MSWTNDSLKSMTDAKLATGTHIAFSADGTSEATTVMARTPLTGSPLWSQGAASNPYQPQNTAALESAAALEGAGAGTTIVAYSVRTALTGGTQLTEWIPITDPDPIVVTGSKLTIEAGALKPCNTTRS